MVEWQTGGRRARQGDAAAAAVDKRQRTIRESARDPSFLQLLLDVTTAANEAPSLDAALPITLERVRAHTGWPLGHACVVDTAGALVSTGKWSTDDPEGFRILRERTDAMRFAPGMGLPGRVLSTGKAEAVTDVTRDAGFLRTDVAVDLGVRAAFAFPVRTGREILGVLEFFSRRSIALDRAFLEVMDHVGTQLGRLVDRMRAREAAEQARQRAEEAMRSRIDVLRMVSHDLRNPLQTIGMAAALLEELPLDERQRSHQVDIIRRAVEYMRRLVDDLMDLERIEAGHGVRVEPRPVEPQRLLDDVCRVSEPQAEARRIKIVCQDARRLPAIHADFERVLQVLWNIVGNALKFTPAGGSILIAVEPEGDAVEFAVTDTGPGIESADIDRLFEPYWQSKKTGRLGAGLGLPIAKGIVESHAGEMWVESRPGQGSTFRFTIPLAPSGTA